MEYLVMSLGLLAASLLCVVLGYAIWCRIRLLHYRLDILSLIREMDQIAVEKGLAEDIEYLDARESLVCMSQEVLLLNISAVKYLVNHRDGERKDAPQTFFDEYVAIAAERSFHYLTQETLSGWIYWRGVERRIRRKLRATRFST